MKQILLTILCAFCVMAVTAQEQYEEPDFIGDVIVINADGTLTQLEKSTVQMQTKANAGVLIVGIGKAKSKITIDGVKASDRLKQSDDFKFIVKAADNASDPMSIINFMKFEVSKKNRQAEVASASTFGSVKSNNLELMPFTARKLGEKSYLITLKDKTPGEYGITVKNPNMLDEKSIIVSTFAIDE